MTDKRDKLAETIWRALMKAEDQIAEEYDPFMTDHRPFVIADALLEEQGKDQT